MEPRGRVALVTGAGRRVGRAIALRLGSLGMRVAVHYHGSESGAVETRQAIEAGGSEAWTVRADLRRAGAPDTLVEQAAAHFGALDVLVNSAAVMIRTPLDTLTVEQWDDMFALNLRAPFFCALAAARAMAGHDGAIVNIADLAGMEAWPAYVPHGITKAGVLRMTESLARVLAPSVRVNAVAPGAVLLPEGWNAADAERLTRTTPLGRIGSAEDVAQAVAYLIQADYVTGETIIVDGGRHVR